LVSNSHPAPRCCSRRSTKSRSSGARNCSFRPAQAKEWIEGGDVPELAKAKNLSYVDIDSGHWPMISAPDELARLLAEAADQS
jgi:hypothetical protein